MAFFRPPSYRFQKWGFTVSVGYRVRMSKRKQCRIVEVRIGEAIIISRGWRKGERFEILWGHASDFGSLCIRKYEHGVLLRPKTGTYRSLQLTSACTPSSDIADENGGVWRFDATPKPMTEVRHFELPEGRLGLELPREWFTCVRSAKKFHLAS